MVLLLAMGLGTAKAQVVDVCAGNDTVELRLGNYKYGYVQWQVSEDNEVWSDIDGAIDTVYRFLPDRPRYYRAEVRFPACSEYNYHSQVSYVQIPPKAIAGPDLTIPAGMVARMNATHVDGAEGEWNIIEGTGGLLENPNDSRSPFFGEEGEYKLTWTLTNSCGSNTDTVSIKCVRMEYQTDLVIVDETDAILSDSTQRLNGEYIICFNDPVPDIHEGSVLMGYVYPSFLRKVVSFEREGNLFTMQTEQGVLTDVIASGAINIDLTADSVSGRKPHVKYLDRFPTRKELKENPFLLRDGSVYVIKSVSNEKGIDDFEFEVGMTSDGYLSFNLLEFDFKKLSNKLDGLKYSSEIRIYPNFNANIVIENLEFKEARIGFYDARVEHIQRINLRKPLSTTLVNKEGCFNKTQILLGGFLIGYIPTLVVLDIPYEFKVEASLNPPMSFTKVTGNTYTYEMYYTPEMTIPAQRNEKGKPYQRTSYEAPVGSIDASFKTGFKASVLLLDVLGPYFEVTGDFNPSICASSETGDIGGNINMGVNLSLGCRLQLFSNQLTLSDRKILDFRVVDYNEPAPKRVVKYRGDNQVYSFGQYLSTPIGVRVDGWFNTSMPLAYVHFDPEHGSVSDSIVFTDINGVAETRWKPGVQYGMDKLRVKVYDCYGNLAGQTPQTFRAYSSATDPCINANLTVEAYEVNENTIIPQVSGGSKPYRYSIDGENYSTTQPTIHTQPGHNYHLCVRDKNGCEADTWYNTPFYDCNNTTLQVNAMVVGNSVTVSGRGGIEPYQYSIGGDFQPSGLFGSLYDGEYTVTVRDALGCERSQHVVISRPGKLDISITEITNGWGNAMVMTETSTLIDRGICWSTHHSPTVQDLHNSYGAGGGFYTFNITALDPEKTYYVRAYALDGSGTSYSREVRINPAIGGNLPRVAGTGVTNVGQTTAVGSGNVTYEGGSPVTERGICWSMIYPTIASSHVSCGVGTGAFTADITGLIPNSTYYARAYATNSYGTAYGEQVEFTTPQNGGGVGTHEYVDLGLPSGLLWATCNVGANAPEEYGDYFAWGETQPKDYYHWSTYQYCMGGDSTLTKYCNNASCGYNGFTDNLTTLLSEDDAATTNWGDGWRMPTDLECQELIDNTTCVWTTQNGVNGRLFTASNGNSIFMPATGIYLDGGLVDVGLTGSYWSRSFVTHRPDHAWRLGFYSETCHRISYSRYAGVSVRPVRSASPSGQSPQVTTSEVTSFTSSTATCGGEVVSEGGTAVTERGVCWSTNHNPTLNDNHANAGAGMGAFVVNATGLMQGTTYYVRAYATNANGTAYGNEVSFTTSGGGIGNHEYVDLGLPSGLLWATCNVGANAPGIRRLFCLGRDAAERHLQLEHLPVLQRRL